ncbi:MAG: peptidoglycan-associated lipoprotein Pal [Desulfobulbus sp.]|jgi:peptidoglycan-associated lipoprotein|nr:peptidoglycan-associated lipoprotein Pal [Desulfobulbus sp.]
MNPIARLFLATTICLSLLALAGCGPKQVSPYTPTGNNMPEGSALDGGMGSITEEMGVGSGMDGGLGAGGTEGLDATGGNGSNLSFAGDNQSDAYKREHGRSSPEMRPIYFDFDQSSIRSDQIPSMEHNGSYLKSNPSRSVLVEGNTDDRGTNEYNLALGERRAVSARNYLVEFGIEESRIRTVSYGEERPLFMGQSEDEFAHNRRDDFILE